MSDPVSIQEWVGVKLSRQDNAPAPSVKEAHNASPSTTIPRNHFRFLELLDNLSDLVEEVRTEYKKGTCQFEPSKDSSIQSLPSLLKSARPANGGCTFDSAAKAKKEEVSPEEVCVQSSEDLENEVAQTPQTNEPMGEAESNDLEYQSESVSVSLSQASRKYRTSNFMRRSQSMEEESLEFHDEWKVMPRQTEVQAQSPVGQDGPRLTGEPSFKSFKQKVSTASHSSSDSNLESNGCLIYPSSNRKLLWDILGLCFIGLELVILPLQLFTDHDKKASLYLALTVLSLSYWSLDVFVSFITAYYTDDGAVEKRKRFIAKNYVKTWCSLDVICIFIDILSLFAQGMNSSAGFVRTVKVMKVFRMVRILKVNNRMESSEGRIRSEVTLISMRILKLLLVLFFTCHCLACGWWAVGSHYNRSRFNWIDDALLSGSIRDRSFGYQYSVCFNWALSQFVSSADVFPTNTAERAYAVMAASLALIGFGSMIAGITSSIMEITEKRNEDNQKELRLRTFLDQHEIPSKLRSQVWSYVRASKKVHVRHFHAKDIWWLQNMPKSMFRDLCVQIYVPVLAVHPMHDFCLLACPRVTKKLASEAMQEHTVGIGKELFLVGERSTEMYFITKGSLWYNYIADEKSEGAPVLKLTVAPDTDISWACELALYVKWRHTGIMEAPEVAELVTLSAVPFCTVMRRECEVQKYARSLLGLVQKNKASAMSDVMKDTDLVRQAVEQARW